MQPTEETRSSRDASAPAASAVVVTPEVAAFLRAALVQQLESLAAAGIRHLPLPRGPVEPLAVQVVAEQSQESSRPLEPSRPSGLPPGPARMEPADDVTLPPSSVAGPSSAAPPAEPSSPAAPDMIPQRTEPEMPKARAKPTPASTLSADPFPACELTAPERKLALDTIRSEVAACTRCKELACTRTQTVFGVGTVTPRLCFLGEAPGADEDRQGEPFVGRAGQLLTKIIEACTLKREDVFILNVLKCRPPDNRTPSVDEVANCRGYFERQLEILRPEFICCLGAVASQSLLQTTATTGKLRGRFHDYRGAKVVVTYHPAYLLRNPAAKKDVWEDMKMLLREMKIPIPKSPA